MEQKPSVAIIILNWNGFDDTVECLNSLRLIKYRNYKAVLVDNGSDNDEGVRLKKMFPEIHLIANRANRGFAGGNNDGISWALQAGFEYIVNLNNDCIVKSDWLSMLLDGIMYSRADFASSRIMYYPETELICSDGDALLPDGTGAVLNHLKRYEEQGEIKPIFSACGAASIYSVECLNDVQIDEGQFFDELYFAYYEDVDLGIRLNSKFYKGVCIPDAVVYHKGTQTAGFRSFLQIFHLEKNRILNELLNYPPWLIVVGELYYCVRSLLRMLYRIFNQGEQAGRNSKRSKNFSTLFVIIKSRKWILLHFSEIWRDRKKRKEKHMINKKIYKHFCWDFSKILK